MRIIFVRHGETIANAEGMICGYLNDDHAALNSAGLAQARETAESLKDEKIDAAYSSDLARAVDTANEILRYHPDSKLEKLQELRERYYGADEGRRITPEERRERLKSLYVMGFRPGGGETVQDVYDRVYKALDTLLKRHKWETVLIVGHGGMGRVLVGILEGVSVEHIGEVKLPGNAEVRIFNVDSLRYLGSAAQKA